MAKCPNCGSKFIPTAYMNRKNSKQSICGHCGATIVPRFGLPTIVLCVLVVLPVLDVVVELAIGFALTQWFTSGLDHIRLFRFGILAVIVLLILTLVPRYKIE